MGYGIHGPHPKFSQGSPPRGGDLQGGGVLFYVSLCRGAQPVEECIMPPPRYVVGEAVPSPLLVSSNTAPPPPPVPVGIQGGVQVIAPRALATHV